MKNKDSMDTIENENNKVIKKNKLGFFKILIIIVITALVTYFITTTFTVKSYLNSSGIQYFTAKIALINSKLESQCIYDSDEEAMYEAALKGYVNGIGDKYTQYLTKDEYEELTKDTSGNYVGIGVYYSYNQTDNTAVIIGVIEDSVADTAGIKAGDIIEKVDGVAYTGEQMDEISAAFKGEEGTSVTVTILRDNEELEFNLIRSTVKIKSVDYSKKENDIGYIKISTFSENTADDFKSAYEDLKNQGITGLIIDLRNNGGGLVTESLGIAETMVGKGNTMLITKDKSENEKTTVSKTDATVDVPVVILINQNSASASEILAGALKDDCGYTVVGTKSYGKGVIQTIYPFNDSTALKVTTEEYFTPKYNKINEVGISPDIEVNLDEEWENVSNVPEEYDLQLKAAIEQFQK